MWCNDWQNVPAIKLIPKRLPANTALVTVVVRQAGCERFVLAERMLDELELDSVGGVVLRDTMDRLAGLVHDSLQAEPLKVGAE